ncbi:centrosomal protein of 44 kDa isoform X5 [Strix uralensis]|uniref:centrosomal protein of 44 kDa isoform X5 n=1 Tax=Strix uralensis TaxID=36305 RepID=UPI003DA7368D
MLLLEVTSLRRDAREAEAAVGSRGGIFSLRPPPGGSCRRRRLLRGDSEARAVLGQAARRDRGFPRRGRRLAPVKSQTRKKLRSSKCEVLSNCVNVLADPSGSALNSKQKPQVERHSGNEVSGDLHPLPLPAQGDNEEELCLDHDVVEVKYEQVTGDNSEIEFLKSQLADCQEKLHKLDWMEDKLHVLEERLKGKVIIDEKDWNNLLSRILLLETELLLQSKKRDLSTEFSNISQECTSSSIPVSPDTEKKEEMPESLHQSSGYSSLLSTDPSPKAMTINSHNLTDISKETTRQRMERISKIIEETSELLKTSSNTSEKT